MVAEQHRIIRVGQRFLEKETAATYKITSLTERTVVLVSEDDSRSMLIQVDELTWPTFEALDDDFQSNHHPRR